jgi:predicted transposase/invertase (TIGR01784 family)
MIIGISPTVDFAFKLMLGSPEHVRVTIHFLNAILGGTRTITRVEIRNPYVGKNYQNDKWIVLDILATDNFGRQLNIEIQTSVPAGLRQRLAFYDARLYVDQMKEGEQYHELRPAIVICVLTKPLFPDQTQLHSDFRLRDEAGNVFSDDLQIHTLELTKLNVTRENLVNATPAERWAYFLRYAETMTEAEIRELFPEPEFVEAAGVLEMINKTPEQLHEYRSRLKLQLDETARLEYARDEGRQEGEATGLQKGRQEGRQEGEILGRIAILQELLGFSQPTREELSGYDLSQLMALAKQLQQQLSHRNP